MLLQTVYKDVNTPEDFREDFSSVVDEENLASGVAAALPNHIYMDAMGFGMGCCCLQMTFQACNIDEARLLYDQLTPMTPILVRILCRWIFFFAFFCAAVCFLFGLKIMVFLPVTTKFGVEHRLKVLMNLDSLEAPWFPCDHILDD